MAYRPINHISEAAGKTVASVAGWASGDQWVVLFTDETYARFGIEFGYYGDRTAVTGVALGEYELLTPDGVEAGLCTTEEVQAYTEREKLRLAEYKRKEQEDEEERERRTFERLKRKYDR